MKKQALGIIIAVFLLCLVLIMPSLADQITLPVGTTVVEDEAFYGDQSLTELVLPEGLLRIGSKAFASTSLYSVVLPRSLQYFAPDAFDFGDEDFEFCVYEGSDAAQLSVEYGLQPKIIGLNKVGISLPTRDLQRWCVDGEYLKTVLEGYNYEVELQYASNDFGTQCGQILSMIDDGCEVLVIAAVESGAMGPTLDKAADKGIKVIAYDRLLMDNENVDYYVTYDNYKVGTVQGTYVKEWLDLDNTNRSFNIEFTAGDPGDSNAILFYNGAMGVLKPYIQSNRLIVKSGHTDFSWVSTPAWKSEVARNRAEDILSSCYADGTELDVWLCSNDSTALGVTDALDANYTGRWPIITGQDCDLPNVRNIITGKQAMSVFKDPRTLAAQAAKMVRQIMNSEAVDVNDIETYDNNKKVVPTFLCDPVFCDVNNYRELLIDSGYYTEEDIGGVSPRPILTYRIGVSIYQFTDNFMTLYRNEFENYFKSLETDDVKYEITIADSKNDVTAQTNQVKNFIAQGMDVIILNLVQTSSADAVIDEIVAAGIPLVLINREPLAYDADGNALVEKYEGILNNPTVCYVGADARQSGTFQGEIIRDLANHGDINGDGKISYIMIEGDPENIDAQYRTTFSIKALTDVGYEVECLNDQAAYWNETTAQEICADALTAYGDKIEVVFCNNDGMALGASTAIKNAGRKVGNDIYLLGIDAMEEAVELIRHGDMTGTVKNDYIGQSHATVDVAVKLLNNEAIDNYYWVDYIKVCEENAELGLLDLPEVNIQMSESVAAGKNCSFKFYTVENATSYSASFMVDGNEIISWGPSTAVPDTNLTIPGYWLNNGEYTIEVMASASGYQSSTATCTFIATGNERPAPDVEVNIANLFIGDACTFTVNTENAIDLRYRVGDNFYTNHINVLDDETIYTTSFYSAGDYEFRFTVRRPGNTWSEWSEPIVIHVAEETILSAPEINVLSFQEEGRDLIVSLSEVTGATRYSIDIYNEDGSIYHNSSLLPDEIISIEIPGYNISAGAYELSAYSYNGNKYSHTTFKSITILDADKPDAPDVEPPEHTTVAINSDVSFVVDTTGADKIAIRYFRSGYTDNVYYDTKAVVEGATETTWTTHLNEKSTWKYAFSVRKNGVWSFWSSTVTITVEQIGSTTLIYAEVNPIEGTIVGEMAKVFKKKVEELSGSSISIDIQGAGVLGSEGDYLEDMLGIKTIDICRVSVSTLTQYDCPKTDLLTLPYLFENREHFWNFANSNLAKTFLNEPQTKNLPIRGLAYCEEGFRNFIFRNSVTDINSLNGLKIRVGTSSIMTGLVSSLGASPAIVPFPELYSSLQNGVVDGSEQPLSNYRTNAFYEVAPYVIMDEHTVSASELIISDNAWNNLTEEEQGWIQEAANYASNKCREFSESKETQTLQYLQTQGVTVIEVPDKTPWREATQAVVNDNLNGEEAVYQSILALK